MTTLQTPQKAVMGKILCTKEPLCGVKAHSVVCLPKQEAMREKQFWISCVICRKETAYLIQTFEKAFL